jgi:predicted TIM-barrel fold metal-dependent hydrolase
MLDGVVDAHTHLFPDGFYRAIWSWFDAHAWNIRFRGSAEAAADELRRVGVGPLVALVYAHKPGAAAYLNAFLAELCRADARIVGVGTVLPGEPGAREIVRSAIREHGLSGIKLHCHVQRMAVDDPRVLEVLGECEALGVPAVVHTGRMPRAPAGYGVDPHDLCGVARTERVLRRLPRLRLLVPHLGIDEIDDYLDLLASYEHLHLDTAMACADYLTPAPRWERVERWASRIMYGSDFPITPYEADREISVLAGRVVSDEAFERIVRGTARAFWRIG